jgi:hypothetical protein
LHSLRIPILLEAFPGARFIHIHRHPYKVAASSMHLWKVMARDNQLKGNTAGPTLEEVSEGVAKFYRIIEKDTKGLASDRYCEVSYEDLEKDPFTAIERIYSQFGMKYSTELESQIRSFRESTGDFKKNSYTFGEEEKEMVFLKMKNVFETYHYER